METETTEKIKQTSLIEDIIFYIIIIPLIVLAITIIWQKITQPDKIPDIFGYKMFVVLDENMDQSIEYGDLVFTHNVAPKDLKESNVIAFRNKTNKVTIHKITDIAKTKNGKQFEMENSLNEVGDTKYVNEDQVEGIIVHRIPNIGLLLYNFQKTHVILIIIGIVLVIGLIAYCIASKLDKRDIKKAAKNSY